MTKSLSRFDHAIAGVVFLGLLVAANPGMAAGDTGTAEEAKAMLERAVAAIETDEAAALAAFTAGDEGFKDRDLYVFCGDAADGTHIRARRQFGPGRAEHARHQGPRPASRSARSSTRSPRRASTTWSNMCGRARARQSLRRKRRTSPKPATRSAVWATTSDGGLSHLARAPPAVSEVAQAAVSDRGRD